MYHVLRQPFICIYLGKCLAYDSVLNMKAVVGAFNQESVLAEALFVIVISSRTFVWSFNQHQGGDGGQLPQVRSPEDRPPGGRVRHLFRHALRGLRLRQGNSRAGGDPWAVAEKKSL